jgi:hypothetical protein
MKSGLPSFPAPTGLLRRRAECREKRGTVAKFKESN